ncbi:hypothetical protein C5167_035328 [Papaver somniferum]|uniref:non-specific serine/threonine protein kinase n=1 Tax=Papaver somniferum TaxID=3469 RepID=A0A4Y7KH11_PAPSO|nr:hypothetical protein C5167_035328 [Papaver somniferum]
MIKRNSETVGLYILANLACSWSSTQEAICTLRQRQPGKHFSEYAARYYAAGVFSALDYLHMFGVVYRGLKPENVLVQDDGRIMLPDFDLSFRCAVSPTIIRTSYDLDSSKQGTSSAFLCSTYLH